MATTRQEDKLIQSGRETVRQISESAAEETRRIGEIAAGAGQDLARVGADVMQRNAELFQNTLRFGLETATAVMGRSTDQFSQTLHQAAERSTRNATSI